MVISQVITENGLLGSVEIRTDHLNEIGTWRTSENKKSPLRRKVQLAGPFHLFLPSHFGLRAVNHHISGRGPLTITQASALSAAGGCC